MELMLLNYNKDVENFISQYYQKQKDSSSKEYSSGSETY